MDWALGIAGWMLIGTELFARRMRKHQLTLSDLYEQHTRSISVLEFMSILVVVLLAFPVVELGNVIFEKWEG